MRNETAYTRRKLWHIDAHRPRRNRSKKSARDTRLGRWTRTTRSMKRQITTATSDTKQKQKVTHDQRRKHGQTQANTFTHAHKPLLLSASEYRDRHGYESWTFWPWHWTYGSCRVKQERGVEHERHEGTEWGAECGTGKAGRIGGRLRHLAQACAPRVNTAGLAWPYGLTFAPPSPSPRPPPARNSIALCSARSTSSFLQNSSRPFAPLASCKPVISILSSLYADSDYSTDYVVAIRFLFIARETVGINLHVFNTYLLFLSVFFFFFNNVVTW